jgi:hypothetical protein
MDIKKYGVFTPYSLMLYTECNTDNPANFLKRNAILFENLVVVPQGIGPLDGTGLITKSSYLNIYSKEKIKYKKEFEELLLTIEDFVEEKDINDFYSPSNKETSMWGGEKSESYIDFIKKYVQNKRSLDSPEIQSREHMEELKYYIGTISSDFQILSESIKHFDTFSALFSEIHEEAFKATYNQVESKTQNKRVISSIESINHFDFGKLSWDEIIILRKSDFLKDFRKKIFEWTNEYLTLNNQQEFQLKIDKYIEDAKFEFIEKQQPKLFKTILTGITGNIPLPIPVNPVSVLASVQQIKNEMNNKKDYGWLFFIQKARKNSS